MTEQGTTGAAWTPVSFGSRPAATSPAPAGETLRVGLVSLGCPKNLVDSEVMLGPPAGARPRAGGRHAQDADVIVVNTCAFIDRAKQESIDTILEMAREKETGRARRLVVTGCLAQRYDRSCAARSPRSTPRWARARWRTSCARSRARRPSPTPEEPPTWVYDHVAPRVLTTPGHSWPT